VHDVIVFYKEMAVFMKKRNTAKVIYLKFSNAFSADSHKVL